jgi:hypothetical protein
MLPSLQARESVVYLRRNRKCSTLDLHLIGIMSNALAAPLTYKGTINMLISEKQILGFIRVSFADSISGACVKNASRISDAI